MTPWVKDQNGNYMVPGMKNNTNRTHLNYKFARERKVWTF